MTHRREFLKSHPGFHPGMLAYSADGQELGEVQKLDEDDLTIEKGQILSADCRLPYDAVEDVRNGHLIVNRSLADLEESFSPEFGGLEEASRDDVEDLDVSFSSYRQQKAGPMPGGESFRDERRESSRAEDVEDYT